MKICIINNIYPPYHRGGAEQVVVQTVKGLRERGHQVVVITATPERDEVVGEYEGVKIYRINPNMSYFYTDAHHHGIYARMRWHLENMCNRTVAEKVDQIIEQEKPEVVHTHNLMGLSFLIPQKIRARAIRHVHTIHDVQLVEPSGMILKTNEHGFRYHGPHTWLYSLVTKKLFGSPDVVISPSQFLLNFYSLRRFFKHSHTTVLRNPLTFLGERVVKNKKNDTLQLLYVGQIEYHKGISILFDALDRLTSSNFELHVAGGGSLLDSIMVRAKNNDRIHVYGRVGGERLQELYSVADITIVPSLCYENSPTVIFESFSFHVPVLASSIEGIAELIEEGKNGITFEAGNVAQLSERIQWCLAHREELVRMKTYSIVPENNNEEYIRTLETKYRV